MADTKFSALPAAGAADLTNEFGVNEAGASKKVTAAQLKTLVNTAPAFAAGSAAAASWPTLAAGTLLTTPEVGAIELDATNLYATTDAGNRGYVPIRHFIRASAAQTLTSGTAAQSIFDSPANGTITLEAGVYLFESLIGITGMSSSTGNAQILFAGTGTFGDWLWSAMGIDAADLLTLVDLDGPFATTNASAASIVTAGAGVALRLQLKGSFLCSVAGTFIPQIDLVTAAAATVVAGSYFMLERMCAGGVNSLGQWS